MVETKKLLGEDICNELGINFSEVVNIYPYGSHIYGTNRIDSDKDYIIVFKASRLASGAFKDNAISNADYSIQGSAYSRGGFQDAINNYNIAALESLSLTENLILKNKWNFTVNKYYETAFIKSIITQSSNSWHIAHRRWFMERKVQEGDAQDFDIMIKKGIWHSIRILMFAIQFKKSKKITDFSCANAYLKDILNDKNFNPDTYIKLRDYYMQKLRS